MRCACRCSGRSPPACRSAPTSARDDVVLLDRVFFSPTPDYLLKVKGDSMRDEGIFDGDLIGVHRTRDARIGQIVVARIDDEITVKLLKIGKDRIRLLPRNPDYAPIEVDARPGLRHRRPVLRPGEAEPVSRSAHPACGVSAHDAAFSDTRFGCSPLSVRVAHDNFDSTAAARLNPCDPRPLPLPPTRLTTSKEHHDGREQEARPVRRPGPDREAVRQGLGDAHGRPRGRSRRGDRHRLADARHRAGHRRPAQGPRGRDLRSGILGQDHADAADHRRSARRPAAPPPSSTPSTRSTRPTRRSSASTSTTCWSSQPDTGEQALEIADMLVRSNAVDMVVIDSVAALTPQRRNRGRDGRPAARPAGAPDEPGAAQADRQHQALATAW